MARTRIFRPDGQLPLVSDVTDPITIGVHPARQANGNRLPLYVKRDIDDELRDGLQHSGFVLVVGEAAAGKSRTAYAAMQAVLPDHRLIAPTLASDITPACELARQHARCCLWLDDLRQFLVDDGITRNDIAELLAGAGHHRVILATIRTVDENRIIGGADALVNISQGVLAQATEQVFVERLFSTAERDRAKKLSSQDVRLADALQHTAHDGLGEYLAWGPQLFSQWQNAWTRNTGNPRAAALIAAAVDCRRAGFQGPLSRQLLNTLHEDYLRERGGDWLGPESSIVAWDWALAPRESGSAPLQAVGPDHCDVFNYLVDEFRRRYGDQAPDTMVRTALEQATAAEAWSVANTAWQQDRGELARTALFRQREMLDASLDQDDPELLLVQANLILIDLAEARYAAGLQGAELAYRKIIAAIPAGYPGALLLVRGKLADLLFTADKLAEAEKEYRMLTALSSVLYGPERRTTLVLRHNLGLLLTAVNRLDEAIAELEAVLEIRSRTLGPAHPHTKVTRANLDTARRMRAASAG